MKRLMSITIALVLVAFSAVTVFAAGINSNEQAVLDELHSSVTMNGNAMYIPDSYVNQSENYFNTIDMTSEESSQIISAIKQGESFLANSGASNIGDLSFEQKQQLLTYGQTAVGVLGLTMSYDQSNKQINIYTKDGSVAFSATPTLVTSKGANNNTNIVDDKNVIKTTGMPVSFNGFIVFAGVAVLVVAGGAVYLFKTKKERV